MNSKYASPSWFVAGALPRDDKLGDAFPIFEDSVPLIDESEFPDRIREYDYKKTKAFTGRIKRQTMGSCASHSLTSIIERMRNRRVGVANYIELSPLSLYKRVGRSPNSGSSLSENVREAARVGVLPVDNAENRARFKHVWPENKWDGRLPSGWEETAGLFCIKEWYDIGSYQGMISAMLAGFDVYYGRSGHAIAGVFPEYRQNRLANGYLNSWGEDWGDGGYGFDLRSAVERSIASYGCFAPRVSPLLEQDTPKLAL